MKNKSKIIVRQIGLLLLYSMAISGALWLSYELRFDFNPEPEVMVHFGLILACMIGLKLVLLLVFGQFGSLLSYFGVQDLARIFLALLSASGIALVVWFFKAVSYAPPRAVILTDLMLSFLVLCAIRMGFRLLREGYFDGDGDSDGDDGGQYRQIGIIGAGDVGASLVKDLLVRRGLRMKPVAFFDDDRGKWKTSIHGVPVVGAPEIIPEFLRKAKLDEAIIAMPSASGKRLNEIVQLLTRVGIKSEIVPSYEQLVTGKVSVSRVRPVEVEDLLGREEVSLDSAAIRKFIEGRVVMVTGAGGSIGSELSRQIARYNPSRLLMLDQAEPSLFVIEQEMIEAGMGALVQPLVADVLDQPRMSYLFKRFKPEVIFHAAAHKHVYLMERQPAEAIHNNSIGTRLLAQMAATHGVTAFVMISTDKAINPTSIMGASKRLAEVHLQALQANNHTATKFIAVRFGNVLGSSGSVIPIFKKQIAAGGPVTVTHADVTRYFMTIPEASGLVMQASVLGKGGEIFVLDMGQPVKIVDLARQMIELSGFKVGEDIEIKFTGLKPGEKLYEELQHLDEHHLPTEHPRIMRFVPGNDARESSAKAITEIEGALYKVSNNELKALLQKVVSEYTPFFD